MMLYLCFFLKNSYSWGQVKAGIDKKRDSSLVPPWRNSIVFHDVFHHLADVGKASATLRVLGSTLTSTSFFFRHDSIHNGGLPIRQDIPLNVGGGVTEAITYQNFYHFLLQMLLIWCSIN
jgi:hypothetical protein